jgi:hypothetical protein
MGAMLSGLKRFQKAGALHFKTLSSFHRIATLDYFFEFNGARSTFTPETRAQLNWQEKIVRVIMIVYDFSDQNLCHLL